MFEIICASQSWSICFLTDASEGSKWRHRGGIGSILIPFDHTFQLPQCSQCLFFFSTIWGSAIVITCWCKWSLEQQQSFFLLKKTCPTWTEFEPIWGEYWQTLWVLLYSISKYQKMVFTYKFSLTITFYTPKILETILISKKKDQEICLMLDISCCILHDLRLFWPF